MYDIEYLNLLPCLDAKVKYKIYKKSIVSIGIIIENNRRPP
jgi:hypothetical protein